jgi:hypothetical protein
MSELTRAHDFVYVHTDIPEGMTIREWRAQRAAERAARREEERAARRRRVRAALAAPLAFAHARAIARSGAAIISRPARRRRRSARYPWPRIRSFRRAAG